MIALKTMFYSPADFASMDSPASMALTDRMNGLFAPLEISPESFSQAYELPIGEHVEKNYKGLSYLSWPFAFRYLKVNSLLFMLRLRKKLLGGQYSDKKGAGC
jgi:hypothetical protein